MNLCDVAKQDNGFMDVVQSTIQQDAVMHPWMQFSVEYCQYFVKTWTMLTAIVKPCKVWQIKEMRLKQPGEEYLNSKRNQTTGSLTD